MTNRKDLWLDILREMEPKIGRAQLLTWFKNTAIKASGEGVLRVGLPLPFFLEWHATHLASITLAAAQKFDPTLNQVEYEVDLALASGNEETVELGRHFEDVKPRKLPGKPEVKVGEGMIARMLNPRYTLDHFIVSPENRLAHAACLRVARFPGSLNPLFIYGGVGLGKTHLLQGTAREIHQNDPKKRVVYVTSEVFVNDVITGIQHQSINHIRSKYRQADVLIVDDIQFIANKDRCQEEFFHTFNALFETGKQVILSSDQPPAHLELFAPRLRSRFEAGMIVDVKMPDLETRIEILRERSRQAGVMFTPEILEYIAAKADRSIRMLEGVLTQTIAKYELEAINPTLQLVSEILEQIQPEEKQSSIFPPSPAMAVTLERLIEKVSDYFTLPPADLCGNSRLRECLLPRQIVMYLAKTRLRLPLAKIGQTLGQRNHTTVIHAVKRIEEQMKNDRQLLGDINALTREVGLV